MDIVLELKRALRKILSDQTVNEIKKLLGRLGPQKGKREIDTLYRMLFNAVNDPENALDIGANQTVETFRHQWTDLADGQFMLSDTWFKENINSILCDEMLLLKPEWFKGKSILDAGCGGGRWSYGLAQLGADTTSVDINEIAIKSTEEALAPFPVKKSFHLSPLEDLDHVLGDTKFDMVFSFGVIHHCKSFNKAFDSVVSKVADDGFLFLYLYGRESFSLEEDLELFKDRMYYNSLSTTEERIAFLKKRADTHEICLNQLHDHFAPLINRRFEFDDIRKRLEKAGFGHIERTMDTTELYIRAFKGKEGHKAHEKFMQPKKGQPFWFNRYRKDI